MMRTTIFLSGFGLFFSVQAQNIHQASCSKVKDFGNAVQVLKFAIGESQTIAETVLDDLKKMSARAGDKTTPMTWADWVERYRITDTLQTYLGPVMDPGSKARQGGLFTGLGKFSKGVWNPQGDTPQVVCENDDYFSKEEFYKDPKTGKQTRYRDDLGNESFKYFDKVNNGNWPVGFELCEKGFTRAFHYKGGKDGHPVIMVCGYGMNLAKRISNLYAIGNNNVKDFSTAEFASKPKRDINI